VSGNAGHAGVLSSLGAAAELAGDGPGVCHQLEAVYRSVQWFVQWGLGQRQLQQVGSVGVDEIHWGQGKRAEQFLSVIYQIDSHCRRLLWSGATDAGHAAARLQALGPEVVKGLRFVCSDMWQPYLKVMAAEASQALHVLDRFHITMHLNQAVDQVRRAESTRLRSKEERGAAAQTHALVAAATG